MQFGSHELFSSLEMYCVNLKQTRLLATIVNVFVFNLASGILLVLWTWLYAWLGCNHGVFTYCLSVCHTIVVLPQCLGSEKN